MFLGGIAIRTNISKLENKTMSKTNDWWPTSRHKQLAMVKNWYAVLTVNKDTPWGILGDAIHRLSTLEQAAQEALSAARNETTRTVVATAKCREAFSAMEAEARDFKRRYFLQPPLRDSDLISLGLKPRDTIPTPSGAPSAQAAVETFLMGRHELGLRFLYQSGNPADTANNGFRVFYSLVAPGGNPPVRPQELGESFFTRRVRDVLHFEPEDSGKTCYMAVQIESATGKKGPWGPITSALIP